MFEIISVIFVFVNVQTITSHCALITGHRIHFIILSCSNNDDNDFSLCIDVSEFHFQLVL